MCDSHGKRRGTLIEVRTLPLEMSLNCVEGKLQTSSRRSAVQPMIIFLWTCANDLGSEACSRTLLLNGVRRKGQLLCGTMTRGDKRKWSSITPEVVK